jgi:coenzyme F420 hydrogenase subunit beta
VLSALALYCLEKDGMSFVLHTDSDPKRPWLNRTIQSRNRADLLSRAGSRYAPSSPCEALGSIERSDGSCVFIGKPCDAAAVAALRRERIELDHRLGLVLTFFCAGTPSSRGTLDVLESLQLNPTDVSTIRYRGEGWPGDFKAVCERRKEQRSLSYHESWSRLARYRPLRCNLCPDGLGRSGDLTCGDAWHQYDPDTVNPGMSLLLVRTRRGQEVVKRASATGYVKLFPVTTDALFAAQSNLLVRRRELFGRLLALKLLGIPVPRFSGFSLFHSWAGLPLPRKFTTVAGTLKRAVTRGWWRRSRDEIANGVGIPCTDVPSSRESL